MEIILRTEGSLFDLIQFFVSTTPALFKPKPLLSRRGKKVFLFLFLFFCFQSRFHRSWTPPRILSFDGGGQRSPKQKKARPSRVWLFASRTVPRLFPTGWLRQKSWHAHFTSSIFRIVCCFPACPPFVWRDSSLEIYTPLGKWEVSDSA